MVKEIKRDVSIDAQTLPQGAASTKSKDQIEGEKKGKPEKVKTVYFTVTLAPHTDERKIPNSLKAHRKAQLTKTADARKHRAVLATTTMGSISRKQLQEYIDAMKLEDAGPATMRLEQALWRGLFNYAFSHWDWKSLWDNPATRLTMPKVDNNRTRVLEPDEQARLDEALLQCKNKLVLPVAILLRESAMRSSEPLKIARWRHVDWQNNELLLSDSKTGSRVVPLSPLAIEALKKIATLVPCGLDDPILNITYDALQSAWRKACERAQIFGLKMHDLRHTAATRLALETGNIFLVKALTGHKTLQSVNRYTNQKAQDVVAVLHAPERLATNKEHDDAVKQALWGEHKPKGRKVVADAVVQASESAVPVAAPTQTHAPAGSAMPVAPAIPVVPVAAAVAVGHAATPSATPLASQAPESPEGGTPAPVQTHVQTVQTVPEGPGRASSAPSRGLQADTPKAQDMGVGKVCDGIRKGG